MATEDPAGSNNNMFGRQLSYRLLTEPLGLAVNRFRVSLVILYVGALLLAIEDVVRREVDDRDVVPRRVAG